MLVNFCFLRINEKDISFSSPTLAISFFEKRDLEWHSCSGEMSLFDELILGVCLLRPVFLSDVLSDVIEVISKYSADRKAILPSLTTYVLSKAENFHQLVAP